MREQGFRKHGGRVLNQQDNGTRITRVQVSSRVPFAALPSRRMSSKSRLLCVFLCIRAVVNDPAWKKVVRNDPARKEKTNTTP